MVNDHAEDAEPGPNWAALVPVARELQTWVDALPVWSERSGEGWAAYLRRFDKQEQELTARLRRMPGCTIARSPSGSTTTLSLAELQAKAQGGTAAACRNWIAKVQRTALDVSRPQV